MTAVATARVLVSDPVSEDGLRALLDDETVEVVVKTDFSPEDLAIAIADYDALIVRSQTKVTAEVLANANRLKVIGRAGVGVDNIDVPAATQKGIIVLNSPEGNTMAATEHTWALLLALARKVCPADASMKGGKWDRKRFTGTELYGKTLGVIGLGKIGGAVARRGQGFEMDVVAYDPFVTQEHAQRMGIRLVSVDELLKIADFVTIHVPKTKDTADMINAERLATMKPTARLINCARGGVVNEAALADAVVNGVIAGAAVDVFTEEPPAADNSLVKAAAATHNLLLTPHLGASTEEAQVKVAVDVAEQIRDYFRGIPARSAVNMPALAPELMARLQPFMTLMEKIGRFHGQLNDSAVRSVEVEYCGDITNENTSPLALALLQGLFTPILGGGINFVNARYVAQQRGVEIKEVKNTTCQAFGYATLVTVRVNTENDSHVVAGTLFGPNTLRITRVDDYWVEMASEGLYIVAYHTDKPGIIGSVGQILGAHDINIAGMQVGRLQARGQAVMVLAVDERPLDKVLDKIRRIEGVGDTRLVEL